MTINGSIRVIGTDKVVKDLNKKLSEIRTITFQELVRTGLSIQRRSQEYIRQDNLIDTGNLRASAFTVWTNGPTPSAPNFQDVGKKSQRLISNENMGELEDTHEATVAACVEDTGRTLGSALDRVGHVIVGYGAYYALYVHEDGVTRNWIGAKFLERAIADVTKDLLAALAGKLGKL